jgi:hypothetical protein
MVAYSRTVTSSCVCLSFGIVTNEGGGLDLEKDAFAPEEPVGEEAEDDEGEGEGDRGRFGGVAMGEEVNVDPIP